MEALAGTRPGDPGYEERLAEFEARIARGEKVEATDWMPDEYRRQLLRLIQMHAHSEIMGALPEREWIPRAPTLRRKLSILAKVQDEVGHAQLIYRVAEDLAAPYGITRDHMVEALIAGKAKFHNVFHYPAETWADVAVIAWLVDGAALVTQSALEKHCSYGPYVRILTRICAEEAIHLKYGEDLALTLAGGTPAQRQMLQDALARWWRPIVHFFGPPDAESTNVEQARRWRIRVKSNDELRAEFLDRYVPKIEELGLTIPDPGLRRDETGRWQLGDPGWEEFYRVSRGEGPMTARRLGLRRLAYEESRWVREALAAAERRVA